MSSQLKLRSLEAYLLGTLPLDDCVRLQRRLVYETSGDPGLATLLLTEHRPVITVGRSGSTSHVRLDAAALASRSLEVVWLNRGGGVMAHLPGQLAAYLVVSLERLGVSVGGYLDLLQEAAAAALADCGFRLSPRPDGYGLWGRSGQIVALGVGVRGAVAYHGLVVNVAPAMQLFGHLETDPWRGTSMGCLMNERHEPAKMTLVRSALVARLSEALGCERYHVHSSHPWLGARSLAARGTRD